MGTITLRASDIQIILKSSRTESYLIINEIRESYPYSKKLRGAKIRTQDLVSTYDLNLESIANVLKK